MPTSRLSRLLRLSAALDIRGSLATADAVALTGCDRETARRDLCALFEADRGDLAFVGDGQHRRLKRTRGRGLAVTFGERLALHFGRQLMDFVGGTALPDWLDELSGKLEVATAAGVRREADQMLRRFRYVSEPYRSYGEHDDVVNEVITALLRNVELRVVYGAAAEVVRVRPYTLVIYRRALYLMCRFGESPGTRVLALDRVRSVERTDTEFRMPERYDPDEILRARFGIHDSRNPVGTVRLRFAAERADLVRARTWHATAHFEDGPDGKLDLVMNVTGQELVRAALEWGPKCEVIEPAWLREAVVAELRAALEQYQ